MKTTMVGAEEGGFIRGKLNQTNTIAAVSYFKEMYTWEEDTGVFEKKIMVGLDVSEKSGRTFKDLYIFSGEKDVIDAKVLRNRTVKEVFSIGEDEYRALTFKTNSEDVNKMGKLLYSMIGNHIKEVADRL